jgi:hypothetical protein
MLYLGTFLLYYDYTSAEIKQKVCAKYLNKKHTIFCLKKHSCMAHMPRVVTTGKNYRGDPQERSTDVFMDNTKTS